MKTSFLIAKIEFDNNYQNQYELKAFLPINLDMVLIMMSKC